MIGLLQRMGVDSEIDVTETCLRIAALQECGIAFDVFLDCM